MPGGFKVIDAYGQSLAYFYAGTFDLASRNFACGKGYRGFPLRRLCSSLHLPCGSFAFCQSSLIPLPFGQGQRSQMVHDAWCLPSTEFLPGCTDYQRDSISIAAGSWVPPMKSYPGLDRCIAPMDLGWGCSCFYCRKGLDNGVLMHCPCRHQP